MSGEFRPREQPKVKGLARFASKQVDPADVIDLAADHAAAVEGRTLFPTTVVEPRHSPRLFVSGKNNPKLGAAVRFGPRAGWPIFHLTLEERATCPRSCVMWRGCYGNAMHMARRHRAGGDLERLIIVEIGLLARDHPDGFLVRLHTLGDFYSRAYVALWAQLLKAHPALHVFGYTARTEMDDDAESRAIAADIYRLSNARWDRFAIRFSRPGGGPQGAYVVDEVPNRPDVVLCPAQTDKTAACATCGLCWAPAFQGKAIAFLRHGMTRRPAAVEPHMAPLPEADPQPVARDETPPDRALLNLAAAGDKIAIRALARRVLKSGD